MDTTAYNITHEELEHMAALAGIPVPPEGEAAGRPLPGDTLDADAFIKTMAGVAFAARGDDFASFAAKHHAEIHALAHRDNRVVELLVMGYKMGIDAGSGACMNDLGALYYMGELVEQDYARAAELYQMAADHGCYQSIINLGYIYEYGRTGECDLMKAYRCYALAAALTPSSEAAYKLGDMYSRGVTGEPRLRTAMTLWEHSLDLAESIVEAAQPAIRIARTLIDEKAAEAGIEYNPLRALSLFQQAEIGLRIDIAENGMTYYEKRLQEAIEGQRRARELVEMRELDV